MKACVQHDLLGQPVEHAAACIIDTDQSTCEVVTATRNAGDKDDTNVTIERKKQHPSRAVTRLLYSTCNLTALELDNDFCIEHLEDQLQVCDCCYRYYPDVMSHDRIPKPLPYLCFLHAYLPSRPCTSTVGSCPRSSRSGHSKMRHKAWARF